MRSPAHAATRLASLARVSRAGARAYGCRPLTVARLARRLARRQAFEYPEALRLGLLDPRMDDAERVRYVSRSANLGAQARLNNGNEVPALTGDKGVFYRYCAALGIPVPELFGILERLGSGWGASGRVVDGRADWVAMVAADLPDEFVIKPVMGYAGRGVRIARREDAGAVWDAIHADPEFDGWLVQERLHNHPDLAAIGGDSALHTVRAATLVGRDARPQMLFAFLKLSLSGAASDNFLGGTTGNAVAGVDVDDGRLGPLLVPRADRPGLVERADSPLTGAPVEGVVLPGWDEVRRIVLEAAPHFLPSRALGWDVALTPGGPLVVETNTRWLPFPRPWAGDVLRRMRAA